MAARHLHLLSARCLALLLLPLPHSPLRGLLLVLLLLWLLSTHVRGCTLWGRGTRLRARTWQLAAPCCCVRSWQGCCWLLGLARLRLRRRLHWLPLRAVPCFCSCCCCCCCGWGGTCALLLLLADERRLPRPRIAAVAGSCRPAGRHSTRPAAAAAGHLPIARAFTAPTVLWRLLAAAAAAAAVPFAAGCAAPAPAVRAAAGGSERWGERGGQAGLQGIGGKV
jgi:hypothetical protein